MHWLQYRIALNELPKMLDQQGRAVLNLGDQLDGSRRGQAMTENLE